MLVDGQEVFAVMLASIHNAKKSIWLESYIFESGATGALFVEALAASARAGVEVLVVVDAFGGMNLDREDEETLRSAGVNLRFFGRFKNVDMSRWLKRDHRKLLLIDGTTAFVGGINISDDYASQESGGKGWHDIHARIRGPVCLSLAKLFVETWRQVGGATLPLPAPTREETSGEWAMALCSNHLGIRTQIRSHLVHALCHARSEVLLASAYFVPDRQIVRAMEGAARRGVFVGLLVPGESDLRSVQLAGEHSYERLLRAGVRIFTWRGSHMHVKAAVVDRRWCHVGSYNLDYMSLLNSLELVVELVGDKSPAAISAILRGDMHASPELDLPTWRQRSGPEKILSNVAYQFRRWL
jgi:cardiolipin synthase